MNSIQRIRKAAGLSQAQMAMRLEVSQSAISQYERGAIQPGIKQAKRLVAIAAHSGLSVSLDQVYEPAEVSSGLPIQEVPHA